MAPPKLFILTSCGNSQVCFSISKRFHSCKLFGFGHWYCLDVDVRPLGAELIMISLPLTLCYSSYEFTNLEAECPNSIPWLFQKPSRRELIMVVLLLCVPSLLILLYFWLFLMILGEPLQLVHDLMDYLRYTESLRIL
jgi:hypothetical protein